MPRRVLQLLLQWLDVIGVHVGITQHVDELPRQQVAAVRYQARQQCVRRNVEGNAQAQVGRPLVHLA